MKLVFIRSFDLKEETGNSNRTQTRFVYEISLPAVRVVCISRLS